MSDTTPIFVRMFQVQERFGVSPDTVRRWESRNLIQIKRRNRMSWVKTEDMAALLEQDVG